jgi:hypothetical protein
MRNKQFLFLTILIFWKSPSILAFILPVQIKTRGTMFAYSLSEDKFVGSSEGSQEIYRHKKR